MMQKIGDTSQPARIATKITKYNVLNDNVCYLSLIRLVIGGNRNTNRKKMKNTCNTSDLNDNGMRKRNRRRESTIDYLEI